IKKTTFYEFDLADKKCKVDVEVFRKILSIFPRVPNEDFIVPPSEESLINFHYELGYKRSNNQAGKVGILWGMFHGKNVDFAKLIWKHFQYQIDYKQSKLKRQEIMPYLRFTKISINYFLSLHKSIPKGLSSRLNTIKDDGVIQRLKFVNKGEDFQEYGRAIPNTMLTDEIKQSEAYKAFIAYFIGAMPPKKTRGKRSQGKKQTVTLKKKSFISADDNIIPKPDATLELGKSINKTEVEIAEEKRHLHETHERLVTAKPTSVDESDGEPANRPIGRKRPSEQLAADMKKATKASKEALRLQQQIGDSSEGDEDDSHQSDDEYMNEDKITWLSTDEEEKGNEDDDDEDDDISIDIEETDNERTNSENGDQAMTDADKNVAEKLEEEKGDEEEEQDIDDQAQKDQVEIDIVGHLSLCHRRRSLRFNDQALAIHYVQIQQEIPLVLSTPLLDVLVLVIPPQATTTTPTPLTTPLPTPPITITTQPVASLLPAIETPDAPVPLSEALTAVLQRVLTLEKGVKKLKQVDHSIVIFKLIISQVPPAVNEFL
nr:hypothetical protein [Tanacetum cinerariifolium]